MTITNETDAAATSEQHRGAEPEEPLRSDDLPSTSGSDSDESMRDRQNNAPSSDQNQNGTAETGGADDANDEALKASGPSRVRKIVDFPDHPPQLTGKLVELKDIVEPQHSNLQWIIVNNTKAMLENREEIARKLDAICRFGGTYLDKHDVGDDGKPKEKPYLPTSLRIKPILNCSEKVSDDGRVDDIFRSMQTEMRAEKVLLEEYKQKLSELAKRMTAGELKARKRLLACDYLDTAMEIAGSRAIAGFCSGGFDPPPPAWRFSPTPSQRRRRRS